MLVGPYITIKNMTVAFSVCKKKRWHFGLKNAFLCECVRVLCCIGVTEPYWFLGPVFPACVLKRLIEVRWQKTQNPFV